MNLDSLSITINYGFNLQGIVRLYYLRCILKGLLYKSAIGAVREIRLPDVKDDVLFHFLGAALPRWRFSYVLLFSTGTNTMIALLASLAKMIFRHCVVRYTPHFLRLHDSNPDRGEGTASFIGFLNQDSCQPAHFVAFADSHRVGGYQHKYWQFQR
ncbi:MAG: hypothetical protein DMG65_08515 [Candidatus Angelobacter sp. Gp1-AA117]|nr:MAG: hypothetical protein DMG65_08515 [Candidatus Angelobacter sp. Gp1-AA117]